MGTLVTIHVVPNGIAPEAAMERAFGWFHEIEEHCTRFKPDSELSRLTAQIGVPVPASAILFEAVQFALVVAEESGGAFDPTVGHSMETRGFNREYRTGSTIRTAIAAQSSVSYRDVDLDPVGRTITLRRPLLLDLGAVAKGLAIDTAARELRPFADFAIDAGGDLYLGGHNPHGEPWTIGIRHPRLDGQLIDSLHVSNKAVCTSGDYERGRHILDPRTNAPAAGVASAAPAAGVASAAPAAGVASATVVAPSAMLADAVATAVFVLGPVEGMRLLNRLGLDGLIVTPGLERHETQGLRHAA